MFKILQQTVRTGIVTTAYPNAPARLPETFRGKPDFDFAEWPDARPAAVVCPTGAISFLDSGDSRKVTVDYGLCVFCGLCAGEAVRITQEFELAVRERSHLIVSAEYELNPDGTHRQRSAISKEDPVESAGRATHDAIRKALGRSLAIRQVDAGSCNGCELELNALNNGVGVIPENGQNGHRSLAGAVADFLDETKLTKKAEGPRCVYDGVELLHWVLPKTVPARYRT